MRKFSLIIAVLFLADYAISQTANPELVTSSGDSFSNTTYQLDWSIGEGITATHSSGAHILTQGFHQGRYEITSIDDFTDIGINITAFPNPTTDYVSVKLQKLSASEMSESILILTNLNGKVLLQDKITKTEKQLDFSVFSPGIYFLTLKQENQLLKSFKIIKN